MEKISIRCAAFLLYLWDLKGGADSWHNICRSNLIFVDSCAAKGGFIVWRGTSLLFARQRRMIAYGCELLPQTLIWSVEILAHSLPLIVMTSCWMLSQAVGFGWFVALASSLIVSPHHFPIYNCVLSFYDVMTCLSI